MGCPQFFTSILVMALLALMYNPVNAQDDLPNDFDGMERNALLALLPEFNNPFLKSNWTSIMCYKNKPPYWFGIQCVNGRVTGIVLENMGLAGNIKPDALVNLTQLSVLSFRNNSISGNVMGFSYNHKLTQIDLSGNMFDGPIPDSLLTLDFLESLQLQDNMLTDSVPAFNQISLREVNVSNNRLSGPIPNTTVLQSLNSSSFSDNPGLCGPPSPIPCTITNNTPNSTNTHHSHFASIFIVVDIIFLILVVALFIIYCRKSRKMKKEKKRKLVDQEEEEKVDKNMDIEEKGKLKFMDKEMGFELDDLLTASAEGLGKGNFGSCYKIRLSEGVSMMVKRLRDLKPLSSNEFEKNLQAMVGLTHPNLLPLLAYYYSTNEKLLIYRFASNGNVYNRIHGGRGTKNRIPFRWSARLSVAHAVARALHYLHLNPISSQPHITAPHGNLKSPNVLLDQNDAVLVSDYGLTSLIALPIASQRMVSYKSPEYQIHKRVSPKSDVWSFGCFVLELLTGRVSAHGAPVGVNCVDLGGWVHRAVREEWTAEIFDGEIAAERGANSGMVRLLDVAIKCCEKSPEKRPEMGEVVREIEDVIEMVEEDDDGDDEFSSVTDYSVPATPVIIANGGGDGDYER
ncbi:hypothetical protein HYC85_009845 [Camellia sinensis]|uniref:Protein kinase domain-containing protein n=1 Tax=Camellia sinensis TaxID=4442 RepID=A0A7J7HI28_CAMSI|nr:hypothetical protein HYC85_009845 [Camellia sinensis]